MLKVFTAFSGYDSQCLALRRLLKDWQLVGWSEIDKNAIRAHNALFPLSAADNYGDISRIDWDLVPDFDMFFYTFPCTDITNQGKAMGFLPGSKTRSSLLWCCQQAIETIKPKYLLMENVPGILHHKHRAALLLWFSFLNGMGYHTTRFMLNACEHGVPQSRLRVFYISELNGVSDFRTPIGTYTNFCIADFLDSPVDVRARYHRIISQRKSDTFNSIRVHNIQGYCSTLCTTHRGGHPQWVNDPRTGARKFSPSEYLRLMGVYDTDILTIEDKVTQSNIYDLAGNSVVVSVWEDILRVVINGIHYYKPALFS